MSITRGEYDRAVYVCQPAADMLAAAIRPDRRGRPGLDPKIYLVGMYLSIKTRKSAMVQSILDTLTKDLPRDLQWDLGVRTGTVDDQRVLNITTLYNFTRTLQKIEYGQARVPDLVADERTRRFNAVQEISQALLAQTLLPRPAGSEDYAVDGTGIDAPERGHRKPKHLPDPDGHEEDLEANDAEVEPVATLKTGRGAKGASDAAWGWRTGHTGRSIYYGYDVEGLIRVPAVGQRGHGRNEPALLAALTVLPAGTDVVEPVLGMVDRLISTEVPIRRLLNDRHYSYKAYERWLFELLRRNIQQVSDLRADDHGFSDWNGLRMAAGQPHCPATPDDLGTIPAPGHDATDEE